MPFFRILTTATKVTASGSRWINRLHYSMYSSSKVEAITILETEKSYVNILLGNYDVPEVSVDLAVTFQFQNISDGNNFIQSSRKIVSLLTTRVGGIT